MRSSQQIEVAIVDDHTLVRQGLVALLEHDETVHILFEAANQKELLEKLEWKQKPDLLLIDFNLSDGFGDECVYRIREVYGEDMMILGLSFHKEELVIRKMMEAGANGFVFKDADHEDLVVAIHDVMENGYYVNKETAAILLRKMRSGSAGDALMELNDIESQMLVMICEQHTNEQIADKLCLAKNTVNTYRNRLLEKTRSANTAGLVVFAIRNGIFHLP